MEDALRSALDAWVADRRPGASLGEIRPLAGGVAARMLTFEVRSGRTTERCILRQPNAHHGGGDAGGARLEHDLLTWLGARGAKVPSVVDLDATGGRFGAPSLILTFVEGAPDFAPVDPIAYATAMADALADLHDLGGDEAMLPTLPAQEERAGGWLETLRPRPPPEAEDRVWLDALRGRFPPPPSAPATLLHGDFWPGNVLWNGGRIVAVIDWEEACRGDPLADLAVSRLDMLWLLDVAAMEAFTAQYAERTGADLTHLPLWDLSASLRPWGALETWAAPWPGLGRPDITAGTLRAKLVDFARSAMARLG